MFSNPSVCLSLGDRSKGKDKKMPPPYSTLDLENEEPPEDDPWDLPELKDTGIKWSGEAAGRPHPIPFSKSWLWLSVLFWFFFFPAAQSWTHEGR